MRQQYTEARPRARTDATSGAPRVEWQDAANCRGRTELMYDAQRRTEARAVCARCPVASICLWSTMATEADAPYPYRYGLAGGIGPAQRRRLAGCVSRADVDERLAAAIAAWAAGPAADVEASQAPAGPRYRPDRQCRGCETVISQPAGAGRPRVWCSWGCYERTARTRNRVADAARKRAEWARLSTATKQRRLAVRRARQRRQPERVAS